MENNRIQRFLQSPFSKVLIGVIIGSIWYTLHQNDISYNLYRCKTRAITLRGVITKVFAKTGYTQVNVNNLEEMISLDVDEVKYKKSFGEYHYYEVGDSIIKEANSNEITVKNGDSICVFTIPCKE